MDNVTLDVLIRELRPILIGRVIQKIKLPGGRLLAFTLRGTGALVLSLDPSIPAIYFDSTETFASNEQTDWLLGLRRHLTGARIRDIRKDFVERRVDLELECFGAGPIAEKKSLLLELIPSRTRLSLINDRKEYLVSSTDLPVVPQIADSFLTADRSADLSRQLDWRQEFIEAISSGRHEGGKSRARVRGVPSWMLEEIRFEVERFGGDPWERFLGWRIKIEQGPYAPRIYFLPPGRTFHPNPSATVPAFAHPYRILVPFELSTFEMKEVRTFTSVNEAVQCWVRESRLEREWSALQSTLGRELQSMLKKKKKLLANLREDQKRFEGATPFKKYSDLLYAQSGRPGPGLEMIRVVDLYDPEQRETEIPLNSRLSLIQNANQYGRLFQKANLALPRITRRLEEVQSESVRLEHRLEQVMSARTKDDLISPARPELGNKRKAFEPLRTGRQSKPADSKLSSTQDTEAALRKTARVFQSSEGLTILVGKTSRENDHLTQKFARGEDFWLHVGGYGGSHVVLRNPAKLAVPPPQSLLEAAQLAAYFSQARNASKVEVHYTQRRHVAKPRGAKAGLVVLRQFKSIRVTPKLL
jgi:predicted ribosome quality control (RQC) complex YloA/Tae2 family protein